MPGTRVYVGNLSWDAQWQDLKDHMRGANQDLNVLHADIMTDTNGVNARALSKSCRGSLAPVPCQHPLNFWVCASQDAPRAVQLWSSRQLRMPSGPSRSSTTRSS